jgi:hypothetical protein
VPRKQRLQRLRGPYRWPPRPVFAFYDGRGRALFSTNNTRIDLSDTLMLHWVANSRKVIMGIQSHGTSWPTWTEERLQHVEWLIRYDLRFDGYTVSIKRATARRGQPCTREFQWILQIRS